MSSKGARERVALYRKHRRLVEALVLLREMKWISYPTYLAARKEADAVYAEWREWWRKKQPKSSRPRGRPREMNDRAYLNKCKRPTCPKPNAPGQAYCTPDCAPYANYGLPERKRARAG